MPVEYPSDVLYVYLSLPMGQSTGLMSSFQLPYAGMELMGASPVLWASEVAILAKLVSIWCHIVAKEQYDYVGETVTGGLA